MADTFAVDPAELAAQAPTFQGAGAELSAALSRLQSVLATEGQCWGADDAGRQFARTYQPDADRTVQDVANLIQILQRTGGKLGTAADSFDNQDNTNGSVVRRGAGDGTPASPGSGAPGATPVTIGPGRSSQPETTGNTSPPNSGYPITTSARPGQVTATPNSDVPGSRAPIGRSAAPPASGTSNSSGAPDGSVPGGSGSGVEPGAVKPGGENRNSPRAATADDAVTSGPGTSRPTSGGVVAAALSGSSPGVGESSTGVGDLDSNDTNGSVPAAPAVTSTGAEAGAPRRSPWTHPGPGRRRKDKDERKPKPKPGAEAGAESAASPQPLENLEYDAIQDAKTQPAQRISAARPDGARPRGTPWSTPGRTVPDPAARTTREG
ncbi:WXG100 family type VII secretion target [Nocardia sp. alder85J]|uniref:WXG100 family type VII secretion target n=1 Tax=Nocardia sp. alder85J TaxID=2862949 RepID=UPI001CD371FB|nr:WXG100 family type VII secretion target [Nocardia sp. alder85J]MCX4095148.1 WXG100 family type VII secretion target [Nocardia sp. alder85J]